MTSVQVKRHLNTIDTKHSDIKHSLLNLVEQFQCLDNIAKSIGLVKDGFSFVNRVAWKTVLSNLEKPENNLDEVKVQDILDIVSRSSEQLENELVPQLQKWRNNWMLEVILIEFVFFSLLTLAVAGVTHVQGLWSFSNFSFSVQPFLYERPVFSLLAAIFLFVSFVRTHFNIRHFVANQIVKKLSKETSEFDLVGAFLKSTRMQHSIFRPDIVGWNWLTKKCLKKNSYEVKS